MDISAVEYDQFRAFLKQHSGIDLADNKQYLVTARMQSIMRDKQLDSLSAVNRRLRIPAEQALREEVINAMTTNETLWFRDGYPFETLQHRILPDITERQDHINIWCAACSSGQEPYSVSMTVDKFLSGRPNLATSIQITASDLSTRVLAQAKHAKYDSLAVTRGLSEQDLNHYFQREGDDRWALKQNIKQRVLFKQLNLTACFQTLGRFDVVFCRNVLIYFSCELKRDILQRIHARMNPGAYLIVGSSENVDAVSELFEMVYCDPGIIYIAK